MRKAEVDISVLIATRNRRDSIVRVLAELAECDRDDLQVETIIVDNGSSDGTYEALKSLAATTQHVKVLLEPAAGKNRALNRAVEIARGEMLLFTDDDVIITRNWLLSIWQAAQRWPEDSIFGGKIVPRLPDNTPAWIMSSGCSLRQFAFSEYSPAPDECVVRSTPFGPNVAIRRKVFESFKYCESIGPAGSFYIMGSETELFMRLKAAGYRFVYVPTAIVGHVISSRQLTDRWLRGRAFSFGRREMRLGETEGNIVKWFKVPRYCYRAVAGRLVNYVITRFSCEQKRVEAAVELWRLLGFMYQARLFRNEAAGDKANVSP